MGCDYCDIIEGKKKAAMLYEDDIVAAFLAEQPSTIGHIVVIPKKHTPILEGMREADSAHLFSVVNKISIALFEAIKSEGTNIIVQNGIEAGQDQPHFSVNIITRKTGDGLLFDWAPKQIGEEEMATIELQLKDEMEKSMSVVPMESEEEAAEPETEKEDGEDEQEKSDDPKPEKEENYMIKQLRRMP